MSNDQPAQLASLKSRLIRLGECLFRQRSWTPIPFMLFLLVCTFKESPDVITWVPGLVFIVMGEGLRIWAVAVIGKESRTRGGGAGKFVTQGPYAYVRNPLYVGNLFLTIGATLISELLWMVPVVIVLYGLQYVPIVLWEEQVLADRFGASYEAYCRQVARWRPWRSRPAARSSAVVYQWRAAVWSERSTLGALVLLIMLMLAKENLHHKFRFAKFINPTMSSLRSEKAGNHGLARPSADVEESLSEARLDKIPRL